MNDSRELAQKIIDKYNTILGVFPVFLLCQSVPNLRVNSKGKVISISNDKKTLLTMINAFEPFTGKFIKRSILNKYMSDYESTKELS